MAYRVRPVVAAMPAWPVSPGQGFAPAAQRRAPA